MKLNLLLLLCCGFLIAADNEPTLKENITVTANRSETPLSETGSTVTVISRQQIQDSGQTFVAEVLRSVPGLDLVQTGGAGKATSVFMRGAASGHTLVLIDGIEMSDPISASNTFNLGLMTIDRIERIEVVSGPQSTLYGSDAMGGVIHIITRRPTQTQTTFTASAGSYGTANGGVDVEGRLGQVAYNISGGYQNIDGFSAAREDLGNTEEDGYRNTTMGLRLDGELNEQWRLGFQTRWTDSEGDIDNGGGVGRDDPNYVTEAEQVFARVFTDFTGDRWSHQLGAAITQHDRRLINGFDEDHPVNSVDANYRGDKIKFDWVNNLIVNDQHALTFGVESEEEEGESLYTSTSSFGPFADPYEPREARTTGVFAQDHITLNERATLTLGGRYDDHDRFGGQGTWRGATAVRVAEQTWLKASLGTGFKAPTLFQLYSGFGDENLTPEESTGWDLGVSHQFARGVTLSATWFDNDFENLIDYDSSAGRYNNVDDAQTEGLEVRFAWQPTNRLEINLNGTFMDTLDGATNERLFRRPDEKANLRINYRFDNRGHLQMDVRHVGERDFQDFSSFPSTRLALDAFTLIHMSGSWNLGEQFTITGRVDNLTDEDYQEVLGYGTPGLSGYLGLRLTR